jgi:hypothetical protein
MIITQNYYSLGKRARGGEIGRDAQGRAIIINTHKPWYFDKTIEGIAIHSIGPYPGQVVTTPRNWHENGEDGLGLQASYHYIVKDKDILQVMPHDEVAWHSGDMRNFSFIGIAAIPMNKHEEFSLSTIETLRFVVSHIRNILNFNPPLKRHFDGTQGKPCPIYYTDDSPITGGQERWEELKRIVNDEK